jgi:hypothetical protein
MARSARCNCVGSNYSVIRECRSCAAFVPRGDNPTVASAPPRPASRDGGRMATVCGWVGSSERGDTVTPMWVTEYLCNQEALGGLGLLVARGELTLRMAETLPPLSAPPLTAGSRPRSRRAPQWPPSAGVCTPVIGYACAPPPPLHSCAATITSMGVDALDVPSAAGRPCQRSADGSRRRRSAGLPTWRRRGHPSRGLVSASALVRHACRGWR